MADVTKEVDKLLKDREKYESWLARLESEKTGTSERAYDKVRQDYQKRLDDVLSQLRSHSESIRGKLGELENKVGELEEERASRSEQLDEARLRNSVGEFEDEKEWKKLEGDLVGSLGETDGELEGVRAEIARLDEIIALVEGAEAQPAVEPEPPPPEPEPEPVAVEPELAVEGERGPESVPAPDLAGVDEGHISLEELVLEDGDLEEASVRAAAEESAPAAKAAGSEAGVGDELAFLESLSLSGGEGQGEGESFSFLEQRGSGTPQTIICPHCSAANDPAEWYCTECGEELPAE